MFYISHTHLITHCYPTHCYHTHSFHTIFLHTLYHLLFITYSFLRSNLHTFISHTLFTLFLHTLNHTAFHTLQQTLYTLSSNILNLTLFIKLFTHGGKSLGKEGGGWRGIGAKTTCSQKVRNCAGRGWDREGHHVLLHSARNVLFGFHKSQKIRKKNILVLSYP